MSPGPSRRLPAGAWALLLCAMTGALACSPPAHDTDTGTADTSDGETDVARGEFGFEIGLLNTTGSFTRLETDDTAEITVGFQGLIFVELALLADEEIAGVFTGDAEVSFSDPARDFNFRENYVEFSEVLDDRKLCPRFRVPFGQDLALLHDQSITLELDLAQDDWRGSASATFTIRDAENCTEEPDGAVVCE